MFNLLLLRFGDLAVIVLMGFYAGVGIRESASPCHILWMLLPSIIAWLVTAFLLKIYPCAEDVAESSPIEKGLPIRKIIKGALDESSRLIPIRRTGLTWFVTYIVSVCWESFYWNVILSSATIRFALRPGLFLWFGITFCALFLFWRCFWICLTAAPKMAKRHKGLRATLITALTLLVIYNIPAIVLTLRYAPLKYQVDTVPADAPRTALVFGAGVYLNGRPSAVLIDRIDTAADLYHMGKVDQIVLSGDNSDFSRNEVDMMQYLMSERDVPAEALILDNEGYGTRETVYNARNALGIDKVIAVSHGFHATRILLNCEHYGVQAITVSADRSVYNIASWMSWHIRDWIGTTLAWAHFKFNE